MMTRPGVVSIACNFGIGLLALALASIHSAAHAQSADLVLCDRLAADPADPDKPADVKGVADIAPSDIATAIKFCKSRRRPHRAGRCTSSAAPMPPTGKCRKPSRAYRKAADKGCTSAMVELGVLYGTGTGVAKDEAQARKLFERAAEGRQSARRHQSCGALGGGGAPPIRRKARACFRRRRRRIAEAQYQLGLMMADGTGGPKDDVAARALFEKAAAQSHPARWNGWAHLRKAGAADRRMQTPPKPITRKPPRSAMKMPRRRLKRAGCPYVIKDKRGNFVTNLCF